MNARQEFKTIPSSEEYATPSPFIAASPHWNVLANSHEQSGFTPFVAFCFTINYILGTGFLVIPWSFVQSGLALSVLLLILSAVISDMTKDYLLETMARAEAMLDSEMHWIPIKKESTEKVFIPPKLPKIRQKENSDDNEAPDRCRVSPQRSFPDEIDGLLPSYHRQVIKIKTVPPKYLVADRKFEVNTLCRVFLGKKGMAAFTLFLSLYMFGLLWAYTTVFASAMADALPIFTTDDKLNYIIYAIIFSLFVVPLSCLELDEQVTVQVVMAGCRFLMLFLMIGTSDLCATEGDRAYAHEENYEAPLFRFQGLHRTLPILVVANMYHHSIPGLSDPVANTCALGTVFRATSIFTSVAYSVIGLILGSAFGTRIEQSSNLNWKDFGGGNLQQSSSIWRQIVSFYIILFPALDVISAFPLNAITLGNNMFGAFYGNRVHEMESNRYSKICFRLLASVPPIFGGILVRELGVVTDYTGCTGFIIGFSIPALLFIRSRMVAHSKKYSIRTYYTSYASRGPIAWLVFWFGIVMVVLVLASLIMVSSH